MKIGVESPLHEHFGVKVGGLDISQPISADDAAEIRRLLDQHHFLLFRGRRILTPAEQVQFCRSFGTLELLPILPIPGFPEVFKTTNTPDGGGLPNAGTEGWHNDGLYRDEPTDMVAYHLVQFGEVCGSTLIANCARAYETLPERVRDKLENAMAVHGKQAEPCTVHRLVRRHPRTGKKGLYGAVAMAADTPGTLIVVGWPKAELEETFAFLDQHLRRPDIMYRHQWQLGDLLFTDNAAVMHLAERTDPKYPRVMHRVSVAGALDYSVQHSFHNPMKRPAVKAPS